jgi:CIC family chloride channel protein
VTNEEAPGNTFNCIDASPTNSGPMLLYALNSSVETVQENPSVVSDRIAVAQIVAKVSGRNWLDCKVLIAAGAGAGLATAFNAPIAGAVFVLEELVRRFDTRLAIAALGASAAAIAVARAFLGAAPDFTVEPLAYVGVQVWPLFVALGAVAGLAGNLYPAAQKCFLRGNPV